MSDPTKVHVVSIWVPTSEIPFAVFSTNDKANSFMEKHQATTLTDSKLAQFNGPYEVQLDPE